MRRFTIILAALVAALFVAAPAQAYNSWSVWWAGDLNDVSDGSTIPNTGQHIYYGSCQQHINVPVGQTRWVDEYNYQGYGAWVGPYHFHPLQHAEVTGLHTVRFYDTETATHNGINEGAVVGTREYTHAVDKYGITHDLVRKLVNQGNVDITFTPYC
jgi:hypothetical protein